VRAGEARPPPQKGKTAGLQLAAPVVCELRNEPALAGLHDRAADTWTFLPGVQAGGSWQIGWLGDVLWHLVLPVACLVYGGFAVLSKQTRAAMLDNFNADYVRTAKAKGVSRRDVATLDCAWFASSSVRGPGRPS
jgi:hypothetical protein